MSRSRRHRTAREGAPPRLREVESPRRYDQPCPLATALDVLGSRWTLLIVRELLLGPKRFGELQRLLPGIGPNRLSQRLKQLQEQRVVEHEDTRYRLTSFGEGLREPLIGVSVWGLGLMGESLDLTRVRADMVALCLAGSARSSVVGDLSLRCEIRLEDEVLSLIAANGRLTAKSGPAELPDAVVTCSKRVFVDLATGAVAWKRALEDADVELIGATHEVEWLFAALSSTAGDLLAKAS